MMVWNMIKGLGRAIAWPLEDGMQFLFTMLVLCVAGMATCGLRVVFALLFGY